MADEIDRASEREQAHNEAALSDVMWRARPEQAQNPDGTWPQTDCDDCGEGIEPGRLAMGKIRCFGCQTVVEHERKQRGLR